MKLVSNTLLSVVRNEQVQRLENHRIERFDHAVESGLGWTFVNETFTVCVSSDVERKQIYSRRVSRINHFHIVRVFQRSRSCKSSDREDLGENCSFDERDQNSVGHPLRNPSYSTSIPSGRDNRTDSSQLMLNDEICDINRFFINPDDFSMEILFLFVTSQRNHSS